MMRLGFLLPLTVLGSSLCSFADERVKPVSDLPKHIKAPASGAALIADFEHEEEGPTPIFLVNRSGKEITVTSLDNHVYCELEYHDPSGAWVRAQPFMMTWCVSGEIIVHANHFIELYGIRPRDGEPAITRFRLPANSLEVTSNTRPGFVRRKDVELAQVDRLGIGTASFEVVSSVALGERDLREITHEQNDPRLYAMFELASGRFDLAKSERVLRKVADSKDTKYVKMAQWYLHYLKLRNPPRRAPRK
jgi:hypothetical protein